MFLACDLGNTFVKMGIYEGGRLIKFLKHDYDSFRDSSLTDFHITGSAVSSVVPQQTPIICAFIQEQCGLSPYLITRESALNIRINYLTPNTLGIDRICSLEGALALFSAESSAAVALNRNTFLLTVDLGTATTINVLQSCVDFTGGIIAPGLKTMAGSLNRNTAELPEIDLVSDYKDFWGRDTRSSIASGIINSTVSLIEKAFRTIENGNSQAEVRIYVTGGNAGFIKPYLNMNNLKYIEDLVLLGVKSIYERNNC